MRNKVKVFLALIIPVLFLVIGFLTISDYGITWDEPVHFMRGEAFFHYFVTGKKDYSDLSAKNIFQDVNYPFEFWIKSGGGHPPFNGLLSSLTVEIFYKRLGVLANVDAHHSIIIILGALCILAVYLFASEAYGRLAGLVAALSLSLYPFFLVACHNQIKMGPEIAFFTLTVWSLWKGLKDRNWKWVLTSSLFCGFALGTKFNVIFLPFIILPWFLILLKSRLIRQERVFAPAFLASLFLYPFLSFFILYACWPWLWPAPFPRFLEVVGYYKTIGTTSIKHWDMIVLSRAIFRTPFLVLLLSSAGIGYALTHFWKEKNKTSLLVLLWLFVPLIRGIAPGMTIYGDLYQISEYIPPLCILAGLGAKVLSRYLTAGMILLLFVPHLFIMIGLHPNEDMYFNFLIGGIKGAQEKGLVDSTGTFGNTFLQGIKWLNEHAEKNARTDVDGLASNLQPNSLRDDIKVWRYFSGLEKKGEYLLFRYETGKINTYTAGLFPEAYLKPVHQIKAQNVPIFNIYKNDAANTYPGMVNYAQLDLRPRWFVAPDNRLEIDLGEKILPCKIRFIFSEQDCSGLADGILLSSVDNLDWRRDAVNLPSGDPPCYQGDHPCYQESGYTHLLNPPFITQFFKIRTNPIEATTCYQKIKDIQIWALTDFINLTSLINIHQSGQYALVSKQPEFFPDFTIGAQEVQVNPQPRVLKNDWLVYNEGINLSLGDHQVKFSEFSDEWWLVNVSDFSIEAMLDSLERLEKINY